MKINLCVAALLFFGAASAQNVLEQQMITSSYNKVKSKELLRSLENEEQARDSRVQLYLKSNNEAKRQFEIGGVQYRIIDVIKGKPLLISTDNANSGRAIRVNNLYPGGSLGLSLEGQGLFVGVWDEDSVLKTHDEFTTNGVSRVTTPDGGAIPVTGNHGTHVAGTVGAKGFVSSAKGMAPKVSIKSYNWTGDATEVTAEAINNGMLISNHSYGIPINTNAGELNVPGVWFMGCYTDASRSWDQIAFNYPYYLPVMSAGNDGMTGYQGGLLGGYDKLNGNKTSKNLLIVANADPVVHPITGVISSLVINPSSSQGPTDDGRIKPDIAADGTAVYSSSNASNSSYVSETGTSMSSPSVAGGIILLQEHYNNLHQNEYMRAATLKALVCHTALDDAASIGPDPKFGWGLLDTRESAIVLTNSVSASPTSVVRELNLAQDVTYSIQVNVASLKKLKATISWTDPAGTIKNNQLNSPTPDLVNDLDLRIIKGDEVNFPWKLQLSDVSAPAIKGDNLVDNVEKVEVDNALGTYTIQVTHKGTLTGGSQNYSLIVSGFDGEVLSAPSFEKSNIAIYPNPAKDVINVKSDTKEFTSYQLYDIQGRLIRNENVLNANKFQVNSSSLAKGMYMLNLNTNEGSFVQKIIKE